MKIFFIRNVPNNIPWSLKVFPVMSVTMFPRKPIKNHVFTCLMITVGIPIVMHALRHRVAGTRVFSEGEEPEVSSPNFMNS